MTARQPPHSHAPQAEAAPGPAERESQAPAFAVPSTALPAGATPTGATQSAALRLHPRASYREVGGEVFVVTEDRGFHRLAAPTAVDLFRQLAAGPCTRDAFAATMTARYAVTPETARQDVESFVNTLIARQIAVMVPSSPP